MTTQLFHVGCGAPLFTLEQLEAASHDMAMACGTCSAGSPIVSADLSLPDVHAAPAMPASVAQLIIDYAQGTGREAPHLEYYLGYVASFRCPAKEAWTLFLRGLGSVSQGECTRPKCRELYERAVKSVEARGASYAGRSLN